MQISCFNKLPEHVCIQIYQCLFKNVLDELNVIYSTYRDKCDFLYCPPNVQWYENGMREFIIGSHYNMINHCKKGHLSRCVNFHEELPYRMRFFVGHVTAYQATQFQQIPCSFTQGLFAVRYSLSPIVNKLIMNIDNEYRKEYRHFNIHKNED